MTRDGASRSQVPQGGIQCHCRNMSASSEKQKLERAVETKASVNSSVSRTESKIISVNEDWKTECWISSYSWNPWPLYLSFRRKKIITVEPVIFLYMLATGLCFPLLQQYILWRFESERLQNTSFPFPNGSHYCIWEDELNYFSGSNKTYSIIQDKANDITFYSTLLSSVPSAFAAVFLGPLTDYFGRKPIIIVVATGAALQALGIIAIMHFELNIYFVLIPSVISGVTGGLATLLTVCFTYIADVSTLKQRTWRIGIVESMMFVGGALAEGVGGYWVQKLDCFFEPPMWVYIGCQGLIIVYVLLYLPESLTRGERKENAQKTPRGFRQIVRSFKIFFCGVQKYSVWRLWAALVAMGVFDINMIGAFMITVFFLYTDPLHWGPKLIGYYGTVRQISHGIALIVILPLFVAIGLPDALIALIGLAFSMGMDVFTGFVNVTWEMFVVGVFLGMEAVIVPTLRSFMSKLVTAEDQAALFSFISATEIVCGTLASAIYNNVYPLTLKYNLKSGTTFLLMALFCLIPVPLLLLLLYFRNRKSAQPPDEAQEATPPSNPSERESLLGDISHSSEHNSDDLLDDHYTGNYAINL